MTLYIHMIITVYLTYVIDKFKLVIVRLMTMHVLKILKLKNSISKHLANEQSHLLATMSSADRINNFFH